MKPMPITECPVAKHNAYVFNHLRTLLMSVMLTLVLHSSGQVQISQTFSEPPFHCTNDKLLLVDFWATWCLPCLQAGKQLEVMQEHYANDLCILSISRESKDIVEKYVRKHKLKLWVAQDFEGMTFDRYQVSNFLPYSVLLDKSGNILWKGHPSDLTYTLIEDFIEQNRNNPKTGTDKVKLIEKLYPSQITNPKAFIVKRLHEITQDQFYYSDQELKYTGRFRTFVSEFLHLSSHQIEAELDFFVNIVVGAEYLGMPARELLQSIADELDVALIEKKVNGVYYELLPINESLLWDTEQINWGQKDGTLLFDENELSIDNATLAEMCFRLSNLKEDPYFTRAHPGELHDWLLPYRYDELLWSSLTNTFGLQVIKNAGEYDVLVIKQKEK